MIAAVVTVIAATQDYGKPQPVDVAGDTTIPAGILPMDARSMVKLDHWRVAALL